MADNELYGNSEQLDCSDCVNHGGDWDCDHVQCHKGADTISRAAALDALAEWQDAAITNRLNNLPSAQPTDAEIQKMQDIEQAMLEKAYECGKQDAMQWIPCSTEMPPTGKDVLVTLEGGTVTDGERWEPQEGKWFLFGGGVNGLDEDVIAWMPLPKPARLGD